MPCLLALINPGYFRSLPELKEHKVLLFGSNVRAVFLSTFTDNVKKQNLVINSLKFDKLFILHSWINESLKINFEQRKKISVVTQSSFSRKQFPLKFQKLFVTIWSRNEGYKLKILGWFSVIHITLATTQTSFYSN